MKRLEKNRMQICMRFYFCPKFFEKKGKTRSENTIINYNFVAPKQSVLVAGNNAKV